MAAGHGGGDGEMEKKPRVKGDKEQTEGEERGVETELPRRKSVYKLLSF